MFYLIQIMKCFLMQHCVHNCHNDYENVVKLLIFIVIFNFGGSKTRLKVNVIRVMMISLIGY